MAEATPSLVPTPGSGDASEWTAMGFVPTPGPGAASGSGSTAGLTSAPGSETTPKQAPNSGRSPIPLSWLTPFPWWLLLLIAILIAITIRVTRRLLKRSSQQRMWRARLGLSHR